LTLTLTCLNENKLINILLDGPYVSFKNNLSSATKPVAIEVTNSGKKSKILEFNLDVIE